MQSVRQASLHPIDMFLIPFRFDDNTGAAKIIEVCERQEKSSEVQERREEKLREVEGLDMGSKSLETGEGGLMQRANRFLRDKLDIRKTWKGAKEGDWGEVHGVHDDRPN